MKQDFVTYFAVLSFDIPGDAGITFPDFPGCTGQCKADANILAYASETLGFFLPIGRKIYQLPLRRRTFTTKHFKLFCL